MIVHAGSLSFETRPGRLSANPFPEAAAGLSMRVVQLEGGVPRHPHRHPHSAEAIYVLSGSGYLWADGRSHRVTAGDCALVDAGVAHATVPDAATSMELVCFFPHPDLDSNIEELGGGITLETPASPGS